MSNPPVVDESTRIILEASPSGMILVDEKGEIAFANRQATEMFGAPPAGLAGTPVDRLLPDELQGGHAAHRANFLQDPTRRAMGTGRDLMARRADGTLFPVEVGLNPFRDQDKMWVLGSIVDISARKDREREERAAQARMLESQRLESLGLLAGGVAHDFNNLLVAILGNAHLAMSQVTAAGPVHECLEDVVLAAEQASDLARQMLAYSGRGRFEIGSIDLSSVVQELAMLLRSMVPRHVNLRVDSAPELPPVEADAAQLRQIILNLVSNAAEAIAEERPGSVTVTTGLATTHSEDLSSVQPAGLAPGTYVYIEVADTGSGMAKETLQHIFDPFFTTKETGHGLGLASTMGIVRAHGGGVRVYSELGRGTVFKVLLPAIEGAEWTEPDAAVDKAKGRVLVVDDVDMVRRLAERVLSRAGYQVAVAEDGLRAVEIAREHAADIDIVLLDLSMPGLSGAETFQQLRQIRPDLKVVLTSGFSEDESTSRLAGRGLAGFIQKPFTPSGLLAKVATVLDADATDDDDELIG